jgi:uncharacterized membrane protein YesL
MRPGTLAARAWELVDVLTWIAALNLCFLVFSLLGGIIFGVAPSAVAASTLVRRRADGDIVRPITHFWPVYKAEFGRANLLLIPVGLVVLALGFSSLYFNAGTDSLSAVLSGVAVVLLAFSVAVIALLVPLYCSYDLPLPRYLPAAVRLSLANPLMMVLNLAVIVGVLAFTWILPGILPFFTVGLLSYLGTRLSLDFINRNEKRRLADPITG